MVPYGEPTWLEEGYHSPYYKEVRAVPFTSLSPSLVLRSSISNEADSREQSHRALQKAMRKFVDEVIYPDAQVGFLSVSHRKTLIVIRRNARKMGSGRVRVCWMLWRKSLFLI
jgi:hypothetical protein